jgi:hypothetical protein
MIPIIAGIIIVIAITLVLANLEEDQITQTLKLFFGNIFMVWVLIQQIEQFCILPLMVIFIRVQTAALQLR